MAMLRQIVSPSLVNGAVWNVSPPQKQHGSRRTKSMMFTWRLIQSQQNNGSNFLSSSFLPISNTRNSNYACLCTPENENNAEDSKFPGGAPPVEKPEANAQNSISNARSESSSGGNSSEPNKKEIKIEPEIIIQLMGPERVNNDDARLLKDKLFGYKNFWVTEELAYGPFNESLLYKGNLRGPPEAVFEELQRGLEALIPNKYDLFMINEPEAEDSERAGERLRVSFVLTAKSLSSSTRTEPWQYIISAGLALLTAFSCFTVGLGLQITKLPPDTLSDFLDPSKVDQISTADIELVTPLVASSVSFAIVLFGIQLVHELGHRVVASLRGVKLGLPYLVFNSSVGSFGAVTPLRSTVPSKTALFDTAIAGPAVGAVASLAVFLLGLALTTSPEASADLVSIPSVLLQDSLLLGLICRSVLGFSAVHAANISIHPLLIAGWCGILTSALNTIPVGSTDGGRCAQAAFGKAALSATSLLTFLLLAIGVLGGPLSLPYGLFVLLFQRDPEKPCQNDVSGVGDLRQWLFVAAVSLSVVTLLPIWDSLADDLGIGLDHFF